MLAALADGGRADRPGAPRAGAGARGAARPRAGQVLRRQRPDRAARADPARGRGRDRPRRNAGHWRLSRPRWTADVRLAGRRTAGRPRSDEGYAELVRPLAAHVRPRHRGRPRVVAGRDEGAPSGPRCAGARRGRGVAGRRRHRLGAARRRRPGGRRRAVGGAAAGARPDGDGLEGARLLPRPARAAPVRHATATPARRPGGTAGSSAAGCRTTPVSSRSALLEKLPRGRASRRSRPRRSG